jgi:bifunctional non-homologous end joining protein LigD
MKGKKPGYPAKLELREPPPSHSDAAGAIRCAIRASGLDLRAEVGWLPSLAYVEGGACRLVSRNRNAFKTFEPLAQAIGQELSGRSAILDGEIVRPGPDGRPMFYAI